MPTITLVTKINAPIERCFDLARSIDLHQHTSSKTNEKAIGDPPIPISLTVLLYTTCAFEKTGIWMIKNQQILIFVNMFRKYFPKVC